MRIATASIRTVHRRLGGQSSNSLGVSGEIFLAIGVEDTRLSNVERVDKIEFDVTNMAGVHARTKISLHSIEQMRALAAYLTEMCDFADSLTVGGPEQESDPDVLRRVAGTIEEEL